MKNIVVAGGVYREICQFPERREILGSGGRAAAALALLDPNVRLHTYAPPENVPAIKQLLGSLKVYSIDTAPSKQLISFRYLHGLATPIAQPSLSVIKKAPSINIKAELVLRFGFIEGDAKIDANFAVYDPQEPLAPKAFSENGSLAKKLAYVINSAEARLLTGLREVERQAQWLHREEKAAVVVIKQGPIGAFVSDGKSTAHIPCFKTDLVWPIGSGDVFSAAFTYHWAFAGMAADRAAYLASKCAAFYCETSTLPLPKSLPKTFDPPPLVVSNKKKGAQKQIYLAGPFFSVGQRWLVDSLRETFQQLGVSVFSPIHDVGEGDAKVVAIDDLKGLDQSSVVFAILDGLDAGTLVEVGYAIAKKIPVVAFTQIESDENLTMLIGTDCVVERDLVSAVYKAFWTALES